MKSEGNSLERTLGPLQVTAGGVGIIIGAGIYVLIGEAAGEAGNALLGRRLARPATRSGFPS